jgi:hypothetical protein
MEVSLSDASVPANAEPHSFCSHCGGSKDISRHAVSFAAGSPSVSLLLASEIVDIAEEATSVTVQPFTICSLSWYTKSLAA